jgi:hypothetical protein
MVDAVLLAGVIQPPAAGCARRAARSLFRRVASAHLSNVIVKPLPRNGELEAARPNLTQLDAQLIKIG